MYKALRSAEIEPVWMVGIDPDSDGLARARSHGLKTTHEGVDGLIAHMREDNIRIAFDATSAYAHAENSRKVIEQGAVMIDLTPAAIGPYCVPSVNLAAQIALGASNLNMVTCGGQATIPMVYAVSRVQPVDYGEIIATVSSRSAGPGTRANIDEFTQTTARAIEQVGGARRGKAIIVLNPADPPVIMRDTVIAVVAGDVDEAAVTTSVQAMADDVARYVPGYRLVKPPVFERVSFAPPGETPMAATKVTVFLEVEGAGHWLPKYAGNLDIMTSAALRVGESVT